ncbi:hypothetical protein [Enterobacter hormaechei]|uniref:hypothetical protein n=1 Tax=Enterobacter hormaechei TaxID=158836 RepID=UPI00403ABD7C
MSGSISGVSLLAADSRKSLITDVQFYEAYTSTALNRKFKNIIKPGIYSGFNVVPGTGLKVTVTSGNEGGAASVDIDNVQLSVQQILDIDVDIPAGQTTIIALQAFYKFGVKTSQVTDESTVNAAEIVTITAQQLKDGQIELCRVAVPEGATQITSEMIDTSFRVFRSLGLQLSAELDSEEEGVAANSLAIKKAISFLSGEGVPEALSTLAQLAAAINNDGNFAQTIDEALDLKAPLTSPTLTGTPKAPTAAQTVNNTQIATTAFVKAAISALVGGSTPEGLDTLSELAAALNNDPQFATTMKKALEGKQPLNQTLTDLSGKTVAGILEYLRLGEGAKMPAAEALASSSGNIAIPVVISGKQQTALIQWKMVSVPQSVNGEMVVVDDTWPVVFPNACLSINPSLTNSLIYATSGAPFVSAAIIDRIKFKAACAYTKSNSTVTVWGIGW